MLETIIPLASHEDNFFWKETQSGTFSVKYAYRQLLRPSADGECWKKIWNPQLIPKINFFWWSLMHGKILTMDNLKRGGSISPTDAMFVKLTRKLLATYLSSAPLLNICGLTLSRNVVSTGSSRMTLNSLFLDGIPPPITPSSFNYGDKYCCTSAGPYGEKETIESLEILKLLLIVLPTFALRWSLKTLRWQNGKPLISPLIGWRRSFLKDGSSPQVLKLSRIVPITKGRWPNSQPQYYTGISWTLMVQPKIPVKRGVESSATIWGTLWQPTWAT